MSARILIYGVTGYTGRLVAERARDRGLDPIVAGRNVEAVAAVGGQLGLAHRAFALDDDADIDAALADVGVLLNIAGPFARTAAPLVEACLRTGTHYLDIAGEVPEFQLVHAYDAAAREAGISLMPGVGLGVVPTDCLAAHLARRLPSATRLRLGFATDGGVSRGTLATVLPDLHRQGHAVERGRLVPEVAALRDWSVDLGKGSQSLVSNPWRADLFSAPITTGIGEVETYSAFPGPVTFIMRRNALGSFWRSAGWQGFLAAIIRRLPEGPSAKERAKGSSAFYGEAVDAAGQRVASRLIGAEAYEFTAALAAGCSAAVLAGKTPAGFQTPAGALGPDFVLGFTKTDFEDLEPSSA